MDWTQNKPIHSWCTWSHIWNTPGLLLKNNLFQTYKTTTNTGEINTKRKNKRPKKQRKAKEILGEGCGGLDGGKCLESGTNSRRSAEVPPKAAMSGNGCAKERGHYYHWFITSVCSNNRRIEMFGEFKIINFKSNYYLWHHYLSDDNCYYQNPILTKLIL